MPSTAVFSITTPSGKELKLKTPLSVHVYKEGGQWFAENSSIEVFGSGPRPEVALRDFKQDLGYMVMLYKNTPDEILTGRAIQIKEKILDIVLWEQDSGRVDS